MSETDTDIDEPPTKMSKTQEENPIKEEHLEVDEEDEMGEGQEEWLSEGILTDDDYNPGAEQENLDPSVASTCENSQMSQDDDETPNLEDSVEQQTHREDTSWTARVEKSEVGKASNDSSPGRSGGVEGYNLLEHHEKSEEHELITSTTKNDVQNIEEALNSFDAKTELTDVLDAFLIRKPESKLEEREVKTEPPIMEQGNDDGNDTDELLRLLGDDDNKLKKKVLVKKSNKKDVKVEDSSDDDFTYEVAASVKTIRVAREVLMKGRPASKAVPEDLSDGGNDAASSDEASTVKKMFGVTAKKSTATSMMKNTGNRSTNQTKPLVKHVVHINKPSNTPAKITPLRDTASNSENDKQHPLKPAIKMESLKEEVNSDTLKPVAKFEPSKPLVKLENTKTEVKSQTMNPMMKLNALNNGEKEENEEIIDEEEFLEEDEDFELDEEEFAEESDMEEGSRRQRIMRPERMDEEVPSDADSHSEDGSLYDEIPSSDSEDLDDWFTLDIRSERAGDYIPLLGPKARELLLEEKKRVSVRLATLRQSLSALTESGRKQAEQLRQATMSLAELDDMLKAT